MAVDISKIRWAHLIQDFPVKNDTVDQFTPLLNFRKIKGDYIKVTMIDDIVSTNYADQLDPESDTETSAGTTAYNLTETYFYPSTVSGDFVEYLARVSQTDSYQNYVQNMIRTRGISVLRELQHLIIEGKGDTTSSTVGKMTGLKNMVENLSRTISVGGALTSSKLADLVNTITINHGTPDCLVMNKTQLKVFREFGEKTGYPTHKVLPELGNIIVPTYFGIPVLRNDFIPDNFDTTEGTAVFAVVLGWNRGLSGFYSAGGGADVAGVSVEESSEGGRLGSGDMIHVKKLTNTANYTETWRVSGTAGLALFTPQAIAALTDIT